MPVGAMITGEEEGATLDLWLPGHFPWTACFDLFPVWGGAGRTNAKGKWRGGNHPLMAFAFRAGAWQGRFIRNFYHRDVIPTMHGNHLWSLSGDLCSGVVSTELRLCPETHTYRGKQNYMNKSLLSIKAKINKWDLINLKSFCTLPQVPVDFHRLPHALRRGSLRFLPPLEVRPSSVAPDPAGQAVSGMRWEPGVDQVRGYTWAGALWNQDCREKYQPQICR